MDEGKRRGFSRAISIIGRKINKYISGPPAIKDHVRAFRLGPFRSKKSEEPRFASDNEYVKSVKIILRFLCIHEILPISIWNRICLCVIIKVGYIPICLCYIFQFFILAVFIIFTVCVNAFAVSCGDHGDCFMDGTTW